MTNRTLVRDRLGALGWQRGSEYRGNRVTQVETMERHNVCRQSISDLEVWQFKRVSGSSGLKVQAAIACWCRRRLCSMVFRLMVSLRLSMAGALPK